MFSITFPKAFWTETGASFDHTDKVPTLITEIQKQGTLCFVQHCLKGFTGRPLCDTFFHNLTQIFHRALALPLPFPLTYASCCQLVEPDMAFIAGERRFPAHRALVSTHSYWATLFQSGMSEGETGTIKIDHDPEDFVRVLEWLYTGSLKWVDVPEAGRNKIHAAIIHNLAILQNVQDIADQYQLKALVDLCDKCKEALFKLGLEAKPSRELFFTVPRTRDWIPAGNYESILSLLHRTENEVCLKEERYKQLAEELPSLLHWIDWDFSEELTENISYADCCQLVEPDVVFIAGERRFPAHRSLLCYYSYWASQPETKNIPIDDDPDDFARLLECLYTGVLKGGENVKKMAQRYQLGSLTPDFSTPASERLFFDVQFQINGTPVSGNRVILASRSPYFRDLLKRDQSIIDESHISSFEEWVKAIHRNSLAPFRPWDVKEENVLSFLKIGNRNKSRFLMEACSDFLVFKNRLEPLVDHLTTLSDSSFKFLDRKFRSLKGYLKEPPEGLKGWLKEYGRDLRFLNLNGSEWVDDEWAEYVAEQCPHLQAFAVGGSKVTDPSIEKVASLCPNLKILGLGRCDVSDRSIEKVAEHCPKLEILDLTGCPKISDRSIDKVVERCCNLLCLRLGGTQVTNPIKIAAPKLQMLFLKNCAGVSDPAIENCPNLQVLSLSGTAVTDQTMEKVAENCPHLVQLKFKNCTKVTEKSILQIVEQCPSLSRFNPWGSGVSESGLKAIEQKIQDRKTVKS